MASIKVAAEWLRCKILGHDYSIIGITGKYKWCMRCRHRIEIQKE